MPEIQKELDGRYAGKNVQAFAISTGDPDWYLSAFKKELGVTFPWLTMDIGVGTYFAALYEEFELDTNEGHPTLMLLDTAGIIRFRGTGYGGVNDDNLNYRAAFDLIGTLLTETDSTSVRAPDQAIGTPPEPETQAPPAVPSTQAELGWEVGKEAPDFTLADMQDTAYTLSDYRGTVVVLEFWSWGCAECGDPNHVFEFKRLFRDYPREQVNVLSVDTYTNPDVEALDHYLTTQRLWYPVLINGLPISYDYRVARMPVLFILDKDGVIQYRKQTNAFDEDAQATLDSLIADLDSGKE